MSDNAGALLIFWLVSLWLVLEAAAWNRKRAVRARENARIRAVRREMRAQLLADTAPLPEDEQARVNREFWEIVGWRADR